MSDSNAFVIEGLGLAMREMERVRESFRIDKEEALALGEREPLILLRERSRGWYQVQVREIDRRVRKLAAGLRPDQPGLEEGEEMAHAANRLFLEILAHLTSTPNRLLRTLMSGGPEETDRTPQAGGAEPGSD